MPDIIDVIRKAIRTDGRTLYRIAKDAKLPYATVHRFAREERTDLGLRTAAKLCKALDLVLQKREGR
jgi:hypothetical protein